MFRAASGPPLTIVSGADRALSGMQTQVQRVNQVGDNPYGTKTVNNWLNAAAFASPALGTYGTSRRNAYFGMGTRVVDLSLVRQFEIGGSRRIEARVEAFNAFNWFRPQTPNGNPATNQSPVTNLSSASFGRYLVTDDPRIMQFALKYQF